MLGEYIVSITWKIKRSALQPRNSSQKKSLMWLSSNLIGTYSDIIFSRAYFENVTDQFFFPSRESEILKKSKLDSVTYFWLPIISDFWRLKLKYWLWLGMG